jgi:hypothetical protein
MGRINWGRVILGGLVAGLIISAADWLAQTTVASGFNERTAALGLRVEALAITIFIVFAFLQGIIAVWLYAAIRPRYGPGAKTAVIAGGVLWILMGLMGWAYPTGMDLITRTEYMQLAAWSLVEYVVATLVGAWLYREEGSTARAT